MINNNPDPEALDKDDFMQQFPNHEHHAHDEVDTYVKPKWWELQSSGYAEGGAVKRPGYLDRMLTAAKPLWSGRDSDGNVVPLIRSEPLDQNASTEEEFQHAQQLRDMKPLASSGLVDATLGAPAGLLSMLELPNLVQGGQKGVDALEQSFNPKLRWLINKSREYSDRYDNLRGHIMGRDSVPEAQNWKERLADTVGEMGSSLPVPTGALSRLGKGLGVMEYLIPTIHPKPANYLHGVLGGTVIKEALPAIASAMQHQTNEIERLKQVKLAREAAMGGL